MSHGDVRVNGKVYGILNNPIDNLPPFVLEKQDKENTENLQTKTHKATNYRTRQNFFTQWTKRH